MRSSIILSTYNQPEWLRKSLAGYAHQRVKPHEVVIADDGSTDATAAVVKAFRRQVDFHVKHVWQEDRGFRKTRILNKAIDAAQGDYLIFSDGDCIPRADYVETHQRLARPGWFLSGGLVRASLELSRQITPGDIHSGVCFRPGWVLRRGGTPVGKLLKLAAGPAASLLNRVTRVLPNWSGSNASCWKRDALAVGGFDERMHYWREDYEFGQRLLHLGLQARQVRYSVITMHLEHGRGYVDPQKIAYNEQILAHTRATKKVVTEFGLQPAA